MKNKFKNILITGSNGQLGSEFKLLSKIPTEYNFYFTDKNSLNICDYDAVKNYSNSNNIDLIINCAAYTNVEKAEDEKLLCEKINSDAVHNLASICKKYNIALIHFSTDFVFNGKKNNPYVEDDNTDPLSQYGKSKKMGEDSLIKINPSNSIIVRTSWLYSVFGSNFLKTIISLENSSKTRVVNDQIGSPTSAKSLSESILKIIPKLNNSNVEIYHFSNFGECSWFDFASHIFITLEGISKISSVSTEEFEQKAKRPKYGVLCCKKIKKDFGIFIPNWKIELDRIIKILN